MKFCYEQFDQDYIRLDIMPQRGGAMRLDVHTQHFASGTITIIDAVNIIDGPDKKFLMQPGETATLTVAGRSCHIRYSQDKKVSLSGDLPIAPFWNGVDPRELEAWPEHLVIE